MNCELCIIGAGPGGYRAAELAAKAGLKVVIIEAGHVGGTCLNVGCIPTKTYVHAATFAEARERMAQVVPQLRQGVETILSHPNITLVRGKASFVDANTVGVQPLPSRGGEGQGVGSVTITASYIIIATGSETKWLPIAGIDDPRVVDSTGLLNLDTLPRRLCIIGAGVIGMEFACVFHRFGSEVTVIEYLKECLPALDGDIARRLRKYLEKPQRCEGTSEMKSGITFKMKTAVENIADIDADCILMATGRKPHTEGLNLEAAGITLAPNGAIPVDDNFQVVNRKSENGASLYAIGDCNGKQMLAHAAEAQARIVIDQIISHKSAVANFSLFTLHSSLSTLHSSLSIMPAAIFTTPEAACVGPTEEQLKACVASGSSAGTAYECRKAFWRANGKALAMNETEGMLKLFSEPGAGRILGCHAYGAHSADIIQEVSALMCRDTTVAQLRNMVHIHPTLSEILLSAAET